MTEICEVSTDSVDQPIKEIVGGALSCCDSLIELLTQIEGNTDDLEGFTDQIETILTALVGFVDGLETLLAGTLTVSGSVEVANDVGNPLPINGTVTAAINGLPTAEFSQVAVTVGEVAVPASNLASRKTVSIKALAANGAEVYIGETGVTTLTGYELSAGDSIEIDADATVALFAVSASGTQRVSVAEVA